MTKSLTPTLHYTRTGNGAPLVMIHGYPLDHTIWDETTPLLADRFDIITPDLRGFGRSMVTPPSYHLADMAADLLHLLDKLKLEQVILAGHSMGGYISLAFARAYPGRVRGLALVASQAIADTPERKQARYDTANAVLEHGVQSVADAMPAKLTPNASLHAPLKALIAAQHPQGVAGALLALAERPDSTPALANFNFPALILHGEADELIPLAQAQAVHAALPHSMLVTLPNVGHMPMLEAPQATADALKTAF